MFSVFAIASILIQAQAAPIQIKDEEVRTHRIGEMRAVHLPKPSTSTHPRLSTYAPHESVALQVIVDEGGSVVSAERAGQVSPFDDLAVREEMTRRFEPFTRNGKPITVTFADSVAILPAEHWGKKIAMPPVKDWSTLRVALSRSACLGSCPSYRAEISGLGTVEFEGTSSVAIPGKHRSKVSRAHIEELFRAFQKSDFFSLEPKYVAAVTDSPVYTIAISYDGLNKEVTDYVGEWVGMPEVTTRLENQVDQVAGTERWIHGNSDTMASLRAEGWDFKHVDPARGSVISSVLSVDKPDLALARDLIDAGVPLNGKLCDTCYSTLESVASRGNASLLSLVLDNSTPTSEELNNALTTAANRGSVEVVTLLLDKGANPNGLAIRTESGAGMQLSYHSTPLASAASGDNVEVMKLLLQRGANPDKCVGKGVTPLMQAAHAREGIRVLLRAGAKLETRDEDGQTALFHACYNEDAMEELIKAGANLEARDKDGATALMDCNWLAGISMLLAHGADPLATDKQGRTVLEHQRASGSSGKEVLALLEAAARGEKASKQ